MAKADRGSKHQCLKCGTKYYDLNREPIVCPNCGAPYVPAAVIAAEKIKAKAKPEAAPEKDVEDIDAVEVETDVAAAEVGAEVVSLEDAEAAVTGKSDDDDDDDDGDDIPEVADVEDVEDIGGEVDNSFIEDDDDDDDDDIGLDVSRDDDD